MTIYIGENDHRHGRSLHSALIDFLRSEGASSATVLRGLAGFGAHSRIHTASVADLSADLPIRLEWIDELETVERLLPAVQRMVDHGLITLEKVEVVQYAAGRQSDPLGQPVRAIMRTGVTTVGPETPVTDLVALLVQRGYRSLPVVDGERRLVGIITDGDLMRRGGLLVRLGLQDVLSPEQLQAQMAVQQSQPQTAADIMTRTVYTVREDESVRQAAAVMAKRVIKRIPVVDEQNRLLGLISRVDVLRTIEYNQQHPIDDQAAPRSGQSVTELMHTDAPTLSGDAKLEEIVRALESSSQRRVIVVDSRRHVQGIITDGDLLRRSRHAHDPGLVRRLRSLVTGSHEPNVTLPYAETAAQLMSTPVFTIRADTPLEDALRMMLRHQIKRLPVVNEHGELVGLLGRNSLLNGLLQPGEA
ncbi:MAG: DUF190 domain-containing protein [Anaerolineales bacterium]|nr:DUF190 domain-containing protein [Anaerolineales bacterium]